MNANTRILTLCASAISAAMIFMYATSPANSKVKPAGFNRNIELLQNLTIDREIELGNDGYYIAGKSGERLFIGTRRRPFMLLEYNQNTNEIKHEINISLSGVDSIRDLANFKVAIDSPYFFISNGSMPDILRGKIDDWRAVHFLRDSGHFFVDAVPISPNSLILRSLSAKTRMFALGKRTLVDTPYFDVKHDILERQIDGVVDVHGTISYDKKTHRAAYVYAYRNQFIVMDSNLNVLLRPHTIDTFSRAHIKIEKIESKGESIVASPPTTINSVIRTAYGVVFVQSNLLSNNEKPELYESSSVIDKYDIGTGKYLSSFYVPNYKKERASDFIILPNKVIALYQNHLITFKTYQATTLKRSTTIKTEVDSLSSQTTKSDI
ncbi:hypothetical protein [Parachryseolinea silvisoli]|uniref:hypothetical protein n=1 Tax=Parachryseolinea silvisoli TaxID=2873601 RepID=UPI002265EB94|nr:hypothetical protein [Parachryseolinea silvisoli]MCD9015442.1 hypothetical protein [Parachryseolinea silvisoli]